MTTTYIGTKLVRAVPYTRGEYNRMRGWAVPADENPDDPGYRVEYLDGGKPNVEGFDGYISWSPADVFERAYHEAGQGMSFGEALDVLKGGGAVAREGWNGMYLFKVPGYQEILPYIAMSTVTGAVVPWFASQTDMLADDWHLVE